MIIDTANPGAHAMSYTAEQTKARKVVDAALAKGWMVSVYDGEEYTVKKSTDAKAIKAALFSTEADSLRLRHANGDNIGMVHFIYGNGAEDLIADHSDNETINAFVASVE